MSKARQKIKATIYDKRGRVLSVGYNSYSKSHPLQYRYAKQCGNEHKIFLHAEISAIIKNKHPSKAYRIYVERYDSKGNPKLAKPCPVCCIAIEQAGICVVEYTSDSP